jgi:hypothetical protein
VLVRVRDGITAHELDALLPDRWQAGRSRIASIELDCRQRDRRDVLRLG